MFRMGNEDWRCVILKEVLPVPFSSGTEGSHLLKVRPLVSLPITEFVSFEDVQPLWGWTEFRNRSESPGCNPGLLLVQPPLGVFSICHLLF